MISNQVLDVRETKWHSHQILTSSAGGVRPQPGFGNRICCAIFSCEGAALEVLMSVCVSMCVQFEILAFLWLLKVTKVQEGSWKIGKVQGMFRECSGKVQGWFRDGSGMVQGWFRDGSGMVQGRFKKT